MTVTLFQIRLCHVRNLDCNCVNQFDQSELFIIDLIEAIIIFTFFQMNKDPVFTSIIFSSTTLMWLIFYIDSHHTFHIR